eukprot:4023900-Amphidinium_carterae.1
MTDEQVELVPDDLVAAACRPIPSLGVIVFALFVPFAARSAKKLKMTVVHFAQGSALHPVELNELLERSFFVFASAIEAGTFSEGVVETKAVHSGDILANRGQWPMPWLPVVLKTEG